MDIYTILISLCVFGAIIGSINNKDKLNRVLYLIISSFVVGVVACRSEEIGTDTPGYYAYFLNPQNGYSHYEIDDIEFGYNLLSTIVRVLYKDGHLFLFICAFLSLFPFVYLIWKESNNKLLSLFLLISLGTTTTFYILFFSMVRQCIALGILCVGLYLLHTKRLYKWYERIFWVFIAFNFHHTSFIALPLFFLDYIKFTRKMVFVSLILSLFIGVSLANYIRFLEFIIGYTDNSYDYYISLIQSNTYKIGVTLPITLLCMAIYYFSKQEFLDNLYVKIFFVGAVVNNIMSLAGNSDRLNLYFGIYGCLVIPNFIEQQLYNKKIIKYFLVVILLSYYTIKYDKVIDNAKENTIVSIVPYKSFF